MYSCVSGRCPDLPQHHMFPLFLLTASTLMRSVTVEHQHPPPPPQWDTPFSTSTLSSCLSSQYLMLHIVHIIQVLFSITGYSIRPSKQVLKHPKWKRLVNLLLSIQLRAVSVLSNQLLYSERSLATNTKILHVAELLPGSTGVWSKPDHLRKDRHQSLP